MQRIYLLILALMMGSVLAQDPPSTREKPVLIRDDRTQSPPEEEVIVPDPAQAKENIKVGDFYFKRKNFKAAADRYQEAILYGPAWIEGYLKLSDALERMENYEKAIAVCLQFLEVTEDPDEAEKINDRLEKLRRQRMSPRN